MSEFVKSFIKKNKPQFDKYKKYFLDNDWSIPSVVRDAEGKIVSRKYYYVKDIRFKGELIEEGKESEYKIQQKIVNTVLGRLKYFIKTVGNRTSSKSEREIIKQMLSLINLHIDRIDTYIEGSSVLEDKEISEIEGKTQKDYQSEEIEFDNLIFTDQSKLTDEINKLNITDELDSPTTLSFLNDIKAPFSMHDILVKEYPEIQKRLDKMGIDLISPPKNEMLIYMDEKDIPVWDEDKHYFEQDKKTLQFYVDEFKKIRRGIVIDGVYITPWLYCHLNAFVNPIPQPYTNPITGKIESKDKILNPPLRDNEWFIIQDTYEGAKSKGEMMFLCATRRGAKTTNISSHLYHAVLCSKPVLVVAGSNSKDLGQIERSFKTAVTKCNPAFRIPNISDDWVKEVKLGIKKKNQRDVLLSTLNVVNLQSGGSKSSEVLAGFTPDVVVLDEVMKAPFLDQLNAIKPAIDSPYGKRLVVILSGTGSSNDALTKDALLVLANPENEDIYNMDWDALERDVPKEFITWRRRKFGTFLPAQMSAKEGMVKIEKPLWEYLGVEKTENLDKIKILCTDWERSLEIIKEDRKKKENNKRSLVKEIVYYPIDPEEIFLSGRTNPFPQDDIRRYKERLLESGDTGKKVWLDYDKNGKIYYELSDKEYPQFPFPGGFHDAPVTIFEDPIENAPYELNVAGLDDYKSEQADTDSLGSFVIVNRLSGDVVASFHSRPDPHDNLHRQGLLLLEFYNSPCYMENADMGFKTYTDSVGFHITEKYLVKSISTTGDIAMDNNSKREYGWTPTTRNKSLLLGNFIKIIKSVEHIKDDDGNTVRTKRGFERIKDIKILDEMIHFDPSGNHDGITAAMSAYWYDFYLTANYGSPSKPLTQEQIDGINRERALRKRVRRIGLFPTVPKRRG